MSPALSELLKLPPGERAELAMALWESLSDAERAGELELTPEQAGLRRFPVEQIAGGSPAENAERLKRVLSGHSGKADASVVALNAAALLMTAGKAADLREGVGLALEALGTGRARAVLDDFIEASRG